MKSEEQARLATLPPPPARRGWGLGEVWLGIAFAVGLASVAAVIVLLTTDTGYVSEFVATGRALPSIPPSALLWLALSSAGSLLAWPMIVSAWKGTRNPVRDFGLRFQARDIALGCAVAAVGLSLDYLVVSVVFGQLLDLDNASNTAALPIQNLSGLQLAGFVAIVAGLTPVAEETFFRGMALPAAQRRLGTSGGLVLQAVLFSILHIGSAGGWAVVATLIVTFVYGIGLGWVRNQTDRLGPTILAHSLVNAAAVASVLLG